MAPFAHEHKYTSVLTHPADYASSVGSPSPLLTHRAAR